VQVEQDAVKAALGHLCANDLGDMGIGLIGDRSRRRRAGGDRQHDVGAFAARQIEIGAKPGAGAGEGPDRILSIERSRTQSEARQRRRHRREGVGLVLHHRAQQAHDRIPVLFGATIAPALPAA
jgi:hypothetical protein